MRWQRLRSRTEREALETGGGDGRRAVAAAPRLRARRRRRAVRGVRARNADRPAGRGGRPGALPRVTPRPGDPARTDRPAAGRPALPDCAARPDGRTRRRSSSAGPKPAPDAYRLRAPGAYPLPREALANPVCGVLGAGTWIDVTSPTTAPVAGSVFMRGYAGLNDVTWSGQANAFAASRDLAFLEGLERYAGTHRRRRPRRRLLRGSPARGRPARLRPVRAETYRDDPMLAPFDPARPIPWVRGWSLRDERPVLVPARLVYYSAQGGRQFVSRAPTAAPSEAAWRRRSSSGCWNSSSATPSCSAGTAARRCRDRPRRPAAGAAGHDRPGRALRATTCTPSTTASTSPYPSSPASRYAATAAPARWPSRRAPPSTRRAVEAAVSEILTYLPHLPAGAPSARPNWRDGRGLRPGPPTARPRRAVRAAADGPARRDYLRPRCAYPRALRRREAGAPDLRDDVRTGRDTLGRRGRRAIVVVDQTPPEQRAMGLHTVCTLVPGLLPIDFGWARQRALDMPRLRTAPRAACARRPPRARCAASPTRSPEPTAAPARRTRARRAAPAGGRPYPA